MHSPHLPCTSIFSSIASIAKILYTKHLIVPQLLDDLLSFVFSLCPSLNAQHSLGHCPLHRHVFHNASIDA